MRIGRIVFALLLVALVSPSPLLGAPFVPTRIAQCVDFSPDGKLVVTGKSGMSNSEFPPRPHPQPSKCGVIQIWDVQSAKMLKRMETFGDLRKVSFSPNGKLIASCRLYTPINELLLSEVRLWDVATGKSIHAFNRCHDFSFSPSGESIAVLSRSKCVVYNLAGFEKVRQIAPLSRAISVYFHPSGRSIAGIVPVDGKFVVRICDVATGELLVESIQLNEPFYSLDFSPDGTLLATGHAGGSVLLWEVLSLRYLRQQKSATAGISRPTFSPDGRLLASISQKNGDVVIWDISTGKELQRFTHQRGTFHTYFPRETNEIVRPETDPQRFVFSPDGSAFFVGCLGGLIRAVDSGQELKRFDD